LVYYTPNFKDENNQFPFYYYMLYFILNLVNASFGFTGFFCAGSFAAQISDKIIGGTYMTFVSSLIMSSNLTHLYISLFYLNLVKTITNHLSCDDIANARFLLDGLDEH
jgi:uncharacterized membrane protein YtjA (UPF0391 family)